MRITGYKSHGVAAAAALVNAVTSAGGDDSADALRRILRDNEFFWQEFEDADAAEFRDWGRTLRAFFEAARVEDAMTMLNRLMLEIPMHPHLADHEPHGLHMHYAPPSARLPHRFRATTLMNLAELIVEHGLGRTGVCAADGCDRVYADTSRAGRRRFCSESCANRTNVAAFRARRRT
ncbi:CGNR zinc finger domain-containing protein [Actinomadura decatromicini]|uniref:CGNR zinc finger domain-containing protein n=1 Tax=Actinomadura decatromicini TaxID=2604572 RepID=A0A5D3F4T5_9ACTN|nr:CGNR zinc finger domain-containing protein [Actinomadura decatromicini]TYK42690.1 CGNR zinc finger domain-containing protein [Actinomadura decatromicini]